MEKPTSFQDDERLTYKRVRYRLTGVIENMPRTAAEIVTGDLLRNLRDDLIQIRAALDWFEEQKAKRFNES